MRKNIFKKLIDINEKAKDEVHEVAVTIFNEKLNEADTVHDLWNIAEKNIDFPAALTRSMRTEIINEVKEQVITFVNDLEV